MAQITEELAIKENVPMDDYSTKQIVSNFICRLWFHLLAVVTSPSLLSNFEVKVLQNSSSNQYKVFKRDMV